MNQSLANKLVLCDLDNLLLGPDGNLTQVVREVLQLFSSRGGRFTVFSQRTPKAVRAILGSVRLSAPALVCGGTLAYHFADGLPSAAVQLCRAGCRSVRQPAQCGRCGHCPADAGWLHPRAAHEPYAGAAPAARSGPLSAGQRSGYPPG